MVLNGVSPFGYPTEAVAGTGKSGERFARKECCNILFRYPRCAFRLEIGGVACLHVEASVGLPLPGTQSLRWALRRHSGFYGRAKWRHWPRMVALLEQVFCTLFLAGFRSCFGFLFLGLLFLHCASFVSAASLSWRHCNIRRRGTGSGFISRNL